MSNVVAIFLFKKNVKNGSISFFFNIILIYNESKVHFNSLTNSII